jgi:hypothetical protein
VGQENLQSGQNSMHIALDLLVSEPDHSYSQSLDYMGPVFIVVPRVVMYLSIDFHNQTTLMTIEIRNEKRLFTIEVKEKRMLAIELSSLESSVPNCVPKSFLSGRHTLSEITAELLSYE